MNAERWERIKELHADVRDLAPRERDRVLARACAGDPELQAEVERLLLTDSQVGTFLDPPARQDPLPCFDLVGKEIGGCEILEEIGRGSGGIVYLARQPGLERKIALKVLSPYWGLFGEHLERFRREAKSESRLRHPNIVSVLFAGEADGMPYLAMELVAGRSLKEHLDEARRLRDGLGTDEDHGALDLADPQVCALLIARVASALSHCHENQIIHRDIKPSNILIDERGEPRIADFGLARDDSLDALSGSGLMAGTPYYMSPEQARAKGVEVDHRTDIYSTGAVLYELLTLQPPFPGPDPPEVLHRICHESAQPIAKLNPKAPRALARICRKAIEKNPAERYASAFDLEADLTRFLGGRRVLARKMSARRWVATQMREHPRAVAASLLLTVGTIMSITQYPSPTEAARPAAIERPGPTAASSQQLPPGPDTSRLSPERKLEEMRDYRNFLINGVDRRVREKREAQTQGAGQEAK